MIPKAQTEDYQEQQVMKAHPMELTRNIVLRLGRVGWGKPLPNLIVAVFTLLLVNATAAEFVFQPIREFFPSNSEPSFSFCRLLEVSNGVFYGASTASGTNGRGTIFKITASGQLDVLYTFQGADGYQGPDGGLVWGDDGNLYGTTCCAGASGWGSFFRFSPGGAFETLYSFNAGNNGATNGLQPFGPLAKGNDGNFYGVASYGGEANNGMVFRFSTNGILTRLASFYGTNGANPWSGLTLANDGNFYGTTYGYYIAPADINGRIYKVTTNGDLSTVVGFNGTNGSGPNEARLVQSADGNLYGTTGLGGEFGFGTAFRLTLAGDLTTLHSFDGTNGMHPGPLTFGCDGNLYGLTTHRYGDGTPASTYGTVFKITTNGTLTTLLRFDGTNAMYPFSDMILASDGNLYGVTSDANRAFTTDGNGGLFFRLVEPPHLMLTRSTEDIQLTWTSFTNAVYRVEFKQSLSDTDWTLIASNITATGNSTSWTDSPVTSNRVYRVVLLP